MTGAPTIHTPLHLVGTEPSGRSSVVLVAEADLRVAADEVLPHLFRVWNATSREYEAFLNSVIFSMARPATVRGSYSGSVAETTRTP